MLLWAASLNAVQGRARLGPGRAARLGAATDLTRFRRPDHWRGCRVDDVLDGHLWLYSSQSRLLVDGYECQREGEQRARGEWSRWCESHLVIACNRPRFAKFTPGLAGMAARRFGDHHATGRRTATAA
jgi:hypothetical protein